MYASARNAASPPPPWIQLQVAIGHGQFSPSYIEFLIIMSLIAGPSDKRIETVQVFARCPKNAPLNQKCGRKSGEIWGNFEV